MATAQINIINLRFLFLFCVAWIIPLEYVSRLNLTKHKAPSRVLCFMLSWLLIYIRNYLIRWFLHNLTTHPQCKFEFIHFPTATANTGDFFPLKFC